MRLCIEIANDDELEENNLQDAFGAIVNERIYGAPAAGSLPQGTVVKIVPKIMGAMQNIRQSLQNLFERITARIVLTQVDLLKPTHHQEVYEFSWQSLIEQHELLAVIMCSAIDKREADAKDFREFVALLKKIDKYDQLLSKQCPTPDLINKSYLTVVSSPPNSSSWHIHHRLRVNGRSWRSHAGSRTERWNLQARGG
jgi:nuclear pore complex protein Nup205